MKWEWHGSRLVRLVALWVMLTPVGVWFLCQCLALGFDNHIGR